MEERSVSIPAMDGYPLAATLFVPDAAGNGGGNGVIVQINGATGVLRGYYARYARYLCEKGFHVLTYDYRGVGDSRDPAWAEQEPTMQDWGEKDLAGIIEWTGREFPKLRLVCVGHSGGGQWLGLASNNARVLGQLSISSQSGYWAHFRLRDWPRLLFMWYLLIPLATLLRGFLPGSLIGGSENLPKGIALNWARWCRSRHYICDRRGRPIRRHFESYRGRMRFYVIDDDRFFGPANAVRALAEFFPHADRQILHLIPSDYDQRSVGHFGFFRDTMSRRAWQETADWLHAAAYPGALHQVA